MKVAVQTIAWGASPKNMETVLREAKEADYDGVEVFQHPRLLGAPQEFYELLKKVGGLALLGLTGGAVPERIQFVSEFIEIQKQVPPVATMGIRQPSLPPLATNWPYVYVDGAQDVEWWSLRRKPDADLVMTIHPHMFKSVQTSQEARALLEEYPWLRFLPDTAHLTIAGENPVEVIEEQFSRLAAVHMKDWTAEFGRAYQFYAQGFVDLGEGDVDLQGVVDFLNKRRFPGWLVVERDTPILPAKSADKARRWLREHAGT